MERNHSDLFDTGTVASPASYREAVLSFWEVNDEIA
jgi:hypothetical protein